ncbi:3-deoxy-7-phosphoheptulonate synthase [Streptomyces lusitanus]|uniref:Phospho-2-dehydro-3-deoxyheptonate aldolase n=1 Tax=Streptomyces lusitanus TaxID=68232 RepID=A0ABU3JUY9_9ACTN|nr:3-deoxy-7-phosphoheptulonate synthase [Streptomyces lusitanus]
MTTSPLKAGPAADTAGPAARQQPRWEDPGQARTVRALLARQPHLVDVEEVLALRGLLARVAAGRSCVVQAGDCAEDPAECTREHIDRKTALLDRLAEAAETATGVPALTVGRMAGQFAKPRSNPAEQVGGLTLPVYRGHMVNGPAPDPESRRPDPLRVVMGYLAAREAMRHVARRRADAAHRTVWTSHEALLLDYEEPLVRRADDGRSWLGSTHWPWIGERTRQVDGAHVSLLAGVVNPVACKVGPLTTTDEVLELCARLDPGREPGRLTLIARMGAGLVADRLPALVGKVRSEGHPVIWLCDPMHGNTVVGPRGVKTRLLDVMAREVREFCEAVTCAGGTDGGLHLETTPDDILECVADASELGLAGHRSTTLCDPRLTQAQALSLVSAWACARAEGAGRHAPSP